MLQKLGSEGEFQETLMEPYFGVINIENDNLMPLPFRERGNHLKFEFNATVSYVRGEDDGHCQDMTTMANIFRNLIIRQCLSELNPSWAHSKNNQQWNNISSSMWNYSLVVILI